ncbi:hypothetical protein ES705_36621 [subsurface metagenome]
MRVLSFIMQGRFAHFCIPYTNVYRLTQPCLTKTAIMGFVGAVLGLYKDDLSLYQKIQCGIEIYCQYRTVSMPYLIRKGFPGSSANKESSRTSVEVIVRPKYRVFIASKHDDILFSIQRLMYQRESIFTPYLGLAQFVASTDFEVSTVVEGDLIEGVDVEVNGVFIREFHGELDFERLNRVLKENIYRITEFEGLKNIKPIRNFEHATFTVNLDAESVPLKSVKNVLKITAWNKYVPIF